MSADVASELSRRRFLAQLGAAGLLEATAMSLPRGLRGAETAPQRPNFVLFFTDDQGYNDVGCFGAPDIRTPHLDRMAREGIRLTNFYAQAVCGPSRAALMTGCYPIRVGEPGNTKGQHTILHPQEITVGEVLQDAGYATALIGKWHLAGGRRKQYPPERMPNAQGFDTFFGTPLHNGHTRTVEGGRFRTQWMRQNEVIDDALDQSEMNLLTRTYTEEAVRFIREHRDQPFFLYLAHNMPHVPLGVSEAFRGRSAGGRYGDVIEELDWSMGQVIATLKDLGLDENTLVLFTSDNGPWVEQHLAGKGGKDAYYGSADPLRGSKMMTWDGGPRVPCIARWPGHIPAGQVSDEIVTTMDVLPTFAELAGAKVPDDRILDGRDAWPVLSGQPGAGSPHEAFYFYCYTHLQAVRSGKWKLVLPRPARPPWCGWSARMVNEVKELSLYDLEADIGEEHNVADEHPEVVARLMKLIERGRQDLGDYDRVGQGARFFDDGPKRPDMDFWKRGRRPRPKQTEYDNTPPVGNLRFNFEGGMDGWQVVEGDLPGCRTDRTPFYRRGAIGKQGDFVLNTLGPLSPEAKGDALTGVLESPVFELRGEKVSFLVGGGDHQDTYVALCDAASAEELMTARGRNVHAVHRVTWDVAKLKGRGLFLRIVDRHTGGWGHVVFDDFSADGVVDEDATAKRRRGRRE
jgi:arylsulfatase